MALLVFHLSFIVKCIMISESSTHIFCLKMKINCVNVCLSIYLPTYRFIDSTFSTYRKPNELNGTFLKKFPLYAFQISTGMRTTEPYNPKYILILDIFNILYIDNILGLSFVHCCSWTNDLSCKLFFFCIHFCS